MLKNNDKSYGWLTILLHWTMALPIIGMFGLGVWMVDLSYYDPWYHRSLDIHKSIGSLMIGLWIAFFGWHMISKKPNATSTKPWEALAAKLMKYALFAMIIALLTTGYLISSADGAAISVFSLFDLPALQLGIENQESVFGEIHEYLAWALIILAALHALAAIKHHVIEKDHTLKRMIKPQQ